MKERLERLTALYSDIDIEYQQQYSGPYKDLGGCDDNCIMIAGQKKDQISGYGRPVVMIGTDKMLKAHIERLYKISPRIVFMDFLENNRLSVVSRFLMQQGLVAEPYFTQIIDLRKSEAELHSDIRKSYKSICNSKLIDFSVVDVLRGIHLDMYGKETRNKQTWKLQDKMVSAGQAFVLSDKKETCAALFYHNKYSAYYACCSSKGDSKTHPLIWEAMKILKSRGVKTLELGEQIFYGHQKNMNISRFKSGFGGTCYTRLLVRPNELKEKENEM